MEKVKVIKIHEDYILFENNIKLYSNHDQECCEDHFLYFKDLSIEDFEGLEFDLTNDNFFTRIERYGIELNPIKGHSIKIPGYSNNNGYYSSYLELVIEKETIYKTYNISKCQDFELLEDE